MSEEYNTEEHINTTENIETIEKDGIMYILSLLVTAIKPMKQDSFIYKNYIENNKVFFIWIIAYFLLFWGINAFTFKSLLWLIIIYYVSIKIAISEFGEFIMRSLQDCRRLATIKEKSRVLPLYKEVYEKALEQSPYLEKDVQIYIIDSITPNAFAIGSKSIIITKGLLDLMTDEEIKSILAHEFGHIANGDTIISIIFTLGNTVFTGMFILAQLLLSKIERSITAQDSTLSTGWITSLMRAIIGIGIFIFTSIGTALLMNNARQREYKADYYSYSLGYGESLISGLYKLYDYTMTAPKKSIDRMKQSHPRIAYRIGEIEKICIYEENI